MTGIPYAEFVGAADPLALLNTTPTAIADLVRDWDQDRWARSYAPGKWSAAEVILHLVHDEINWSHRIRFALTSPGYIPAVWEGPKWVAMESPVDPGIALETFLTLRRFNLFLYRRLTPEQRRICILHPEFGEISVEWILRVLAGHDVHHLHHLQAIAAQ